MLGKGFSPNLFMAWIGQMFLKTLGWHIEGKLPDIKKFIIIAAPHTSNWDFPITLAVIFALKIKIYWMGKAAMFRWPFRAAFRWFGGIPIERSRSHNIVDQSVQAFNERENLIMVIPPEGTRKKVHYWKTGFYHIARGANIPIVLGYLDYRRKACGIGRTFYSTGRIEEDMHEIKAFYVNITGKRRDLFSNANLKS